MKKEGQQQFLQKKKKTTLFLNVVLFALGNETIDATLLKNQVKSIMWWISFFALAFLFLCFYCVKENTKKFCPEISSLQTSSLMYLNAFCRDTKRPHQAATTTETKRTNGLTLKATTISHNVIKMLTMSASVCVCVCANHNKDLFSYLQGFIDIFTQNKKK